MSVIIPALNESASIAQTLLSIKSAVVPPCEVIVVDGGSSDGTAEQAERLGAKVVRSARGRGKQLNAGWRAARGDWCLFLHSDSRLPPQYDARIAAALRRAEQRQRNDWQGRPRWAARQGLPGGASPVVASCTVAGCSCCIENSPGATPPSGVAGGAPCAGSAVAASARCGAVASVANGGTGGAAASRHRLQGIGLSAAPLHTSCCSCDGAGADAANGGVGASGVGAAVGTAGRRPSCTASSRPWAVPRHAGYAGATTGACGRSLAAGSVVAATSAPAEPFWGAFATISTDLQNPVLGALLSSGVELRTRLLGRPYGDQALFVRRDVLEACGGFKEWPLLEDLELVTRLNKEQPPAVVDGSISTSGRRWQAVGFWRTFAINQAILVAYALGVPPDPLADWYRNARGGGSGGNSCAGDGVRGATATETSPLGPSPNAAQR